MNGYKKIETYQEALRFEEQEDYREAFKLYIDSAKQGYAKAQLAVAKYYLNCEQYSGVIKKDDKKAIEFLQLAADGGNAEAKCIYALLLLKENSGINAAAIGLLKDAYKRRYMPAAYELAYCYCYGRGCKKDYVQALKLLYKVLYTGDDTTQKEYYNGICAILIEIKNAVNDGVYPIDDDSLILLNDLCSDLNISEE